MSSSDLILYTLLSNAALCFSKALDEQSALLFALGACNLDVDRESPENRKLICKVYFRIF
jgi:hypothetical protein